MALVKCIECDNVISSEADFCPKCGYVLRKVQMKNDIKTNDGSDIGLNIISFIFPFIGFILFLIYLSNHPTKAKNLIISSIIGFLMIIILISLSAAQ